MGSIEPTSGWIFKPLIVEPTEDRFFFLMRSKLRLECCRKRKLKTFFVAKERSPLVFGNVCCFSPRLSTLPQVGWNAGFYSSRSEKLGVKEGRRRRNWFSITLLASPTSLQQPLVLANTKTKTTQYKKQRHCIRLSTISLADC